MNEQVLNSVYQLRTHPFAPAVDETGAVIAYDVFGSPLDPQTDPRSLAYYFDVYDWSRFETAAGLGTLMDAAQSRPGTADLLRSSSAGPLMVLISGFDNSGRESLLNLLMRVLSIQHPGIVPIEVGLADVANDGNVLTVAQIFLYSYNLSPPAPPQAVLAASFDTVVKNPVIGPDTAYHSLFQIWRTSFHIRPAPAFALVLRGNVNRDTWRVIYNSTSTLFSIFIVLTHREDYADGCFNALSREGRNVALVKAKFLDKARATVYVQWRLAQERISPAPRDALSPFTNEALDALFEKGSRPDDRPITFPVGFVNKTLRRAMDDKLAQLAAKGRSASAPGPQDQEVLIRAQEIRAARKTLNFGK
jgi:hypothetical protein